MSLEQVKPVLDRALEMVEREITLETVNKLLVSRKTKRLYANFPSKKVRKWALERQKRYGLPHPEEDFVRVPLLYACMRRVYKEIEFDLGRNVNIGWAVTCAMDVEDGLKAIIESKLGLKLYSIWLEGEVEKEFEEAVEAIKNHCRSIVETIRNVLLNGLSLGALRWYQALGYPESMTIMEFDGKELRRLGGVDFRK